MTQFIAILKEDVFTRDNLSHFFYGTVIYLIVHFAGNTWGPALAGGAVLYAREGGQYRGRIGWYQPTTTIDELNLGWIRHRWFEFLVPAIVLHVVVLIVVLAGIWPR